MIYHNKARAMQVAKDLQECGCGMKYWACRVFEGWTVICGYVKPRIGQYGTLEVA